MGMRRQFRDRKRVILLASPLAKCVAVAGMYRRISLQIRQREVHPPVAAVGRAKQGEERLVLVDGQQLPIAQRPAFRGEVEGHDPNFGKKGFGHGNFLA